MRETRAGRSGAGCRAAVSWLAAASFAVWLAAGCSAPPPESLSLQRTDFDFVWPEAPERARIGFVAEVRSGDDLGQERGWLARLVDKIAGRGPIAIVKPLAVARNGSGLLAVADPGVPTVHYFDFTNKEYHRLEREEAARLQSPVGVALDDRGNAYVTDSASGRVFVYDARRRFVGEIGEGVLVRPTGVALDPSQEHLYVVDTVACEVFTFDLKGATLGKFGGRGSRLGRLNSPTYLAVSPDGTLAISDTLNFRVQTFTPDGAPIRAFGRVGNRAGNFARPKGIAYDSSGRLYVVDGGFDNIQIFDATGNLLLAVGGPGRGPGRFNLPVGLALDSTRTLWIADSYNGRVQAFRLLEVAEP